MAKVRGVYRITNNATGDCYIGSSNNIERRWISHKSPAYQNQCPNSQLYLDMQKYGLDNFTFEVIEETDKTREREQYYIEKLQPTYNRNNAYGRSVDKLRDTSRRYHKKSDKQLCFYNGEILTLCALAMRFKRSGIIHYHIEARKYIINK